MALAYESSPAVAQQPRDWVVSARDPGTYLNLDVVYPGIQVALERRGSIYGRSNEWLARASALGTLAFAETQIDSDLRVLFLTLGGTVGAHQDFRLHALSPEGQDSRAARRTAESAGRYRTEAWLFGEGRATLSLPFNDYVVLQNVNTARYDGRPDRSFDWRSGVTHDGLLLRADVQLFFKHRALGALAPTFQALSFAFGGERSTQLSYGATILTRPGLVPRNDLFYLQFLYHFGDSLGGDDNSVSYGSHALFGPFTFIAAYRVVLELDPKRP